VQDGQHAPRTYRIDGRRRRRMRELAAGLRRALAQFAPLGRAERGHCPAQQRQQFREDVVRLREQPAVHDVPQRDAVREQGAAAL
jgi:hypothetical protein